MDTDKDLISIIVPVYNVKSYIEECLNSIINQTYENIEIILVNDESSDGSKEICEIYREIDRRITLINQKHGGLSSARNTGLSVCTGNYICFVDSDDYIKLNYVEELHKAIKDNNTKMSMCGFLDLYTSGKIRINSVKKKTNICKSKEFLRDCWVNAVVWNKMYDSSIWKVLRFDIGKLQEDLFIMHKIMYNDDFISVVKQNLYVHRIRSDSITGERFNIKRSDDIIEASENRLDFFKNKEAVLYARCLLEIVDKIRCKYCMLYVYDKKAYKDELRKLYLRAKAYYKEYLLYNNYKYHYSIKNTLFIIMPNFISKLKSFKAYINKRRYGR